MKFVLIFSTTFIRNVCHSKKNLARYFNKCENVFMSCIRYSFRLLMKIEFSRQIFDKSSNIKCRQNPSSGSRIIPCGRTDGRADMTKVIVAFRNFANAPRSSQSKIAPTGRSAINKKLPMTHLLYFIYCTALQHNQEVLIYKLP